MSVDKLNSQPEKSVLKYLPSERHFEPAVKGFYLLRIDGADKLLQAFPKGGVG